MGLPEILIEFKTKAQTAVTRSQNGIVAVILEDSTKVGDENLSYTYNYEADIVKSLPDRILSSTRFPTLRASSSEANPFRPGSEGMYGWQITTRSPQRIR